MCNRQLRNHETGGLIPPGAFIGDDTVEKDKPNGILLNDWKRARKHFKKDKNSFKLVGKECPKCKYRDLCLHELETNWDIKCKKDVYKVQDRHKEGVNHILAVINLDSGAYDTSKNPSFSVYDVMFWDYTLVSMREWFDEIKYKIVKWYKVGKGRQLRYLVEYIEEHPVEILLYVTLSISFFFIGVLVGFKYLGAMVYCK